MIHTQLQAATAAAAQAAAEEAARALPVSVPSNNRPQPLGDDEWVPHVEQDFLFCTPRQGEDEDFSICCVKSVVKVDEDDRRPKVWVMWWERRNTHADPLEDTYIQKPRAAATDVRKGW